MPDFSGPIQALELASWLWLVPLFPLLGALTNALYCSGLWRQWLDAFRAGSPVEGVPPHVPSARAPVPRATVARIAVASMALSAVAAAVHTGVLLVRAPGERFLLCHLWQMVRTGPLEVGLDLAFDPLAAVLVLLVTTLGTLVCMHAAAARAPDAGGDGGEDPAPWRFFGWFGGLVFSMLLLLLADNMLLLLLAWEGVGLTGYGLVALALRKGDATSVAVGTRAFLVQRAGDAAVLLGVALLFWGLGGSWTPTGEYQSDLNPRLAAVSVTESDAPLSANDPSTHGAAATQGTGFLTVTGLAGALVYADDSRTPLLDAAGWPITTPFRRHEMKGGAHSFRVAPDDRARRAEHDAKQPFVIEGGVLPNYTIARQPFGGDHEVALAVIGPTVSFRELRDELVLSDAKGAHPMRDALAGRRSAFPGGMSLVTFACIFLLLGAATKSAQVPVHTWLAAAAGGPVSVSALVQGGGMMLAGAYLVLRLSCVFSLSHTAGVLVAVVGIVSALVGAVGSAFEYDLRRVLAYSSVSQLGLAFVALGANAYAAAVFQLTIHAIVKTCLLLAAASLFEGLRSAGKDGHATHDLREMGALAATMPRTATAYRVGCLALTTVPIPLLAGFWSTGAILKGVFATSALPGGLGQIFYALMVVAAGLTSFGMWRSYYLAFAGRARDAKGSKAARPGDPEPAAVRRLSLLAMLAAVSGVVLGASARDIGGVSDSLLHGWLAPVFATTGARFLELSVVERFGILGLALAVAYAGWASARGRYGEDRPDNWAAREAKGAGRGVWHAKKASDS